MSATRAGVAYPGGYGGYKPQMNEASLAAAAATVTRQFQRIYGKVDHRHFGHVEHRRRVASEADFRAAFDRREREVEIEQGATLEFGRYHVTDPAKWREALRRWWA